MSERRFVSLVEEDSACRRQRWAYGFDAIANVTKLSRQKVERDHKAGVFNACQLASVCRYVTSHILLPR